MIEKEYGIKTELASPRNPQANTTIEIINQVLGNLVRTYNLQETYVDDTDPCMGILATHYFTIRSTYHRNKGKITGQLLFGRDMIPPINHMADCKYICQSKEAQIEKYLIRKKSNIFDYDYRFGDQVMIRNKT